MNLPERFLNDVKELLGDEFDDFIKSYEQKKTTAIRVNTMKMEKDRLKGFLDCNTEDIPWAEEGLYAISDMEDYITQIMIRVEENNINSVK